MSATITALYPPPQSIDSLDQWGTLDSLPWSLDSSVWTTCGVYGLTVSESGTSSDSFDGATKVYGILAGSASASGALDGEAVTDSGPMPGTASASQSLSGNRVRTGDLDGDADSEGDILGGCVVNGDQRGEAYSYGSFAATRKMTAGEAHGFARSGAEYAYALTMDDFVGNGTAQSGEIILPEYKGWSWDGLPLPSGQWSAMETDGGAWQRMPGSAAAWDRIPDGSATWRRRDVEADRWTQVI